MAAKRKQQRIVAYLGGLYPIGLLRNRQAKANTLREFALTPALSPLRLRSTQREGRGGTVSS